MGTLHDFHCSKKLDLFVRALLLDRNLAMEKTTRAPRVHLVIKWKTFFFGDVPANAILQRDIQ